MSDQIGIVEKAVNSLGKGFDLASDFRLKYCKGNERLILLNDSDKRELKVPGVGAIDDVSSDIKVDKGDRVRYQSDILNFNQMSEFFNQKSAVTGKIPSGLFNAMFGFQSGSWATDAGDVKSLGLDGHFIILFNVHIDRYPLVLSDQVRNAVPSSWDPCALASFIENYGTHIAVGLSIGGEDVVLVKQDHSSNLEPSEIKKHLQNLGDQLFTGTCSFIPLHAKTKQHKQKLPHAFNVFNPEPIAISSFVSMNTKDGLTVICSRRGGDPTAKSHCEWLLTVPSKPDAINFSFIPITSLLKGVPGKGFLSHAINLYLRYKPPIGDLQYFLDFQSHKIWAPIYNDLPLAAATNRSTPSPSFQFNLMGPKLYINTNKVLVDKKPVTGMRFYLEGMKSNRLAIHLQHLSNTPLLLQNKIVVDDTTTTTWKGSDDVANHEQYLELINKKKSSAFICTAPVVYDSKYTSSNINKEHAVPFIVTGAQLLLKKQESKTVLHLRLLFSKVSHFSVVQSTWKECSSSSSEFSQRTSSSSIFSTINQSFTGNQDQKDKQPAPVIVDSGVFPTGPPEKAKRLLRFVDTSHMCKGPQDNPGHWLVTGARLNLDSSGKIGLHVNFSLLNICT